MTIPEEYEKCLVGLNPILREAWTTASNTSNEREKIQALSKFEKVLPILKNVNTV
jgi:hypothetical protein